MNYRDEFERRLIALVSIQRKIVPKGFIYVSREDFVLQHGTWFDLQPIPEEIPHGAPRMCFGNAILLSAIRRLRYFEGVAMATKDQLAPVHHAWNADANGRLIDNTWMNQGKAYCGVEFSIGRANAATWTDDAAILENPTNDYAIFKQPWSGEDYTLRWPDGHLLDSVSAMLDEGGW